MSEKEGEYSPAQTDDEPSSLESVDQRMVSMMRLILALSALTIIYIDPSEPDRFVAINYAALVLYSVYSAVLYFLSVRRISLLPTKATHWIDVFCYLVFVALSSGTNSVFFFFFFFAILVASFRWGFRMGLQVTVISALLFSAIGFATAPAAPYFEWNRFLLRPIYLLVLGYMMSYWGGQEIKLKRQLNLLKEVTRLANPRFGVAHTLATVMRKLRAFYDAERCLLVWSDLEGTDNRLLSIERDAEDGSTRAEKIPAALAKLLRALPENLAVVYNAGQHSWSINFWSNNELSYCAYDVVKRESVPEGQKESEALAAHFEAGSFASIPLRFHGKSIGRLYLAGRRGLFDDSDLDFLHQVIEQITPILDNIRLLERFASNAAEQERQRLARDIHDSVIQPYLGLQFRLAAIRNKLANKGGDVSEEIERLFQSTIEEVNGLRGFVRGLKDTDRQRDDLLSAVRRFAAQFSENYDIEVEVECKGKLHVNDRLAAEVIKFVHEGLSNIRKHTQATHSTISLECSDSACLLRIENNGAAQEQEKQAPFWPRSISERAEELGGHARVEQGEDNSVVVAIEIPL